jgi:hypothetical protein
MAWPGRRVPGPDPSARPLPDGEAKRANHRSTHLPHKLNRSDDVPEPDRPASVDESAGGGGGGAARVGEIGEGGDDDSVRGTSGPWVRPLGPMVMCAVRRTAGAPTGPVTTMMRRSSASSSLPSSSP